MRSFSGYLSVAMRVSCVVVCLVASSLTAHGARGQTPTAKEIVQKYIDATGGAENMAKVKSIMLLGHQEELASGGKAKVAIVMTKDGYLRIDNVQPEFGVIFAKVRNGDKYWSVTPPDRIRTFEPNVTKRLCVDLCIHKQLTWLNYDGQVTVQGTELVNAKPAWKLQFADAYGGVNYRFFDKESGLLVKEVYKFTTTFFSNYRDVNGVKIAHMESIDLGQGIKYVLTYDEIEANVDIPEGTFEPPVGIGPIGR